MGIRRIGKLMSNTAAAAIAVWLLLALVPGTRGPVLALSELAWGGTLPIFPTANCRIVNSDLASRVDGSVVVLGEIVGAGKFNKHVWAVAPDGKILDEACPVTLKGCSTRLVYAVVSESEIFRSSDAGRTMIGYELTRRMVRSWL